MCITRKVTIYTKKQDKTAQREWREKVRGFS